MVLLITTSNFPQLLNQRMCSVEDDHDKSSVVLHCIRKLCRSKPRPNTWHKMASERDVRIHLLQAFMNRRVMKKKDCEQLCKHICQFLSVVPAISMVDTIVDINGRLEPLGLKIQSSKMEHDGSEWIGLVNTIKDDVVRKTTQLSLAQLEFFKNVLCMIVENDGNITSSRAINICDSMERKLTKRSAQELLKTLKKTYWLYEKDGEFSLGPRSALELLPFLEEITGQDIDECLLCSCRVVQGQRCTNCNQKLHLHCIKRLFTRPSPRSSASTIKCPSCHYQWVD